MRKHLVRLLAVLLATALGCSDGGSTPMTPNGPAPGSDPGGGGGGGGGTGATGGGNPGTVTASSTPVSVSGKVLDYETNMPVQGSATVATVGILPAPSVTTTGADYMIAGVPPHLIFYLLAGSPPDYASTYNNVITVGSTDVSVDAKVVKQSYVSSLQTAFGVQPQSGTGTLIARLVDAKGMPVANVPAAAITLAGAKGPYFLDGNNKPAPAAKATGALGLVVFFDVAPGAATLSSPSGAGWTLLAGAVPTGASAVTLADVATMSGNAGSMPPAGGVVVSFATNVVPIFAKRGCANCHSEDGPGLDQGGLALTGSPQRIYTRLTQDISPNYNTTRVNVAMPDKSLVLTVPSYNNPPSNHPTVVFASPADPDYQTILAWIKAGAKLN